MSEDRDLAIARKEASKREGVSGQVLVARSHSGTEWVALENVRCFVAEQKYVRVHHLNGSVLLNASLRSLLRQFGGRFVRVHRNALVSLPHVQRLVSRATGTVVCLQGISYTPKVSRRVLASLRDRLQRPRPHTLEGAEKGG